MTESEVAQWFFDLERVTGCFNWPINFSTLVVGKRAIDEDVDRKAPASDVLAAYLKLASGVGPTVMTSLLQSDDAFPEVNHSGEPTPPAAGKVTLYVDPAGKRVLAECFDTWGKSPVFSLE